MRVVRGCVVVGGWRRVQSGRQVSAMGIVTAGEMRRYEGLVSWKKNSYTYLPR